LKDQAPPENGIVAQQTPFGPWMSIRAVSTLPGELRFAAGLIDQ
jgi:hypothetical protein